MHPPPYPPIPYSLCKLSGLYNEPTPLPSAAALQMKWMPLPRPVSTGNCREVRWGEARWGAAAWGRLPRGARSPVAIRLKYLHVAYLVRIIRSLIVTDSLRMRPVVVHVLLLLFMCCCCCSWCCCCSLLSTLGFFIAYSTYLLAKQVAQSTVRTAPITPTAHRRPLATEPRSTTATVAAAAAL